MASVTIALGGVISALQKSALLSAQNEELIGETMKY